MTATDKVQRAARAYLRTRPGLSFTAWATELHVSRQRLYRVLSGESLPSLPLAIRLRDELSIPIEWLAGVDDGRVAR